LSIESYFSNQQLSIFHLTMEQQVQIPSLLRRLPNFFFSEKKKFHHKEKKRKAFAPLEKGWGKSFMLDTKQSAIISMVFLKNKG